MVDATNPDNIRYLSRSVQLPQEYEAEAEEDEEDEEASYMDYRGGDNRRIATSRRSVRAGLSTPSSSPQPQPQPKAGVAQFVRSLPPTEKALFGAYLSDTVFPSVHGQRFPQMADLSIWQVFDRVELEWYHRHWKSYTTTR